VDARKLIRRCAALTPLLACACGLCGALAWQWTGAPSAASAAVAKRVKTQVKHSSSTACGARAPETLAQAAGLVARRIYEEELSGTETQSDRAQVEEYAPLMSAIENNEQAAITKAVENLVYSHTHVVRLRVTRGESVLADVGGPYILAPVTGVLRSRGRTIAHYVLSVQDDLGYVKLETRFIGVPVVLSAGSQQIPVEGQMTPAPAQAQIPAHGPVQYGGVSYQAFSFAASAFPSGPLRISLLLPLPGGIAKESCTRVGANELGLVAQRISRQFSLGSSNFSTYIKLTQTLTGGLTYIYAGARQIAGSTPHGPARLPSSGTVRYRGVSYEFSSFTAPSALGSVSVYELIRA
jgi:hypothetical protein